MAKPLRVPNLSWDRLAELLDVNPATGMFVWKAKSSKKTIVGSRAGGPHRKVYRSIQIDGQNLLEHHLMWFFVKREWPSQQIDHRNGNRSDNSFDNLRLADDCSNHHNMKKPTSNTSGYKGVSFDKKTQKWQATIRAYHIRYHLGYFYDKLDAAAAYVEATKKYHGEFACVSR